jgi:sugar phosphate isomerase/epimerase
MKVGVFIVLFGDRSLKEALKYVTSVGGGVQAVELPIGNYPGPGNLYDVKKLAADKAYRDEILAMIKDYGLTVSAVSCHGNPLHPDKKFAKSHHDTQRLAMDLAQKLGTDTVVVFSGCPGDSDSAKYPNWVTCPWPDDYLKILEWQWSKKVIPYWKQESKYAASKGVKLAFEAHPGFVVYNPETIVKLRENCGNNIGANFDPSHFWWQGIEPINAVKYLAKYRCIYHVHAKDTKIDPLNSSMNGNLDTKHYGNEPARSWVFRTVGYGHGREWWNNFVSTLRWAGYDGALSIEHEDSIMSTTEGFVKAVEFLNGVVLKDPKPGKMHWA